MLGRCRVLIYLVAAVARREGFYAMAAVFIRTPYWFSSMLANQQHASERFLFPGEMLAIIGIWWCFHCGRSREKKTKKNLEFARFTPAADLTLLSELNTGW